MPSHPNLITNFNTKEKLGLIHGKYTIKEESNTKYLKASRMLLNNWTCDYSPTYLTQINYEIFNTVYTLHNYSIILFEPVDIIIEFPEFYENKYNLNAPKMSFSYKDKYTPSDYHFYKEQHDKLFEFLTKNYSDFIHETGSSSESPAEIAIRLLKKQ